MLKIFFYFLLLFPSLLLTAEDPFKFSLANIGSSGSAFVKGVNTITGEFCYRPVDLVVPGALPLRIERQYDYNLINILRKGAFDTGVCFAAAWDMNHYRALAGEYVNPLYNYEFMLEGLGTRIYFEEGRRDGFFWLDTRMLDVGLTNTARDISAKTNLKNMRLNNTEYSSRKPDGSVTKQYVRSMVDGANRLAIYAEEQYPQPSLISYDLFPSGFFYQYEYNKGSTHFLKEIHTHTPGKKCAGYVEIDRTHFDPKSEGPHILEITSDHGQKVIYTFDQVTQYGVPLLTHVQRPEGPDESYSYTDGFRIDRPDQRYLQIEGKPKADLSGYLVKALKSPAGHDNTPIATHSFAYSEAKNPLTCAPFLKLESLTQVTDANGSQTDYYSTSHRLVAIVKHLDQKPFSKEIFIWGKDQDKGNLKEQIYFGRQDRMIYYRHLHYDKRGNVLSEKLYGELTGTGYPVMRFDPKKRSKLRSKPFCKRYEYSQDDYNLMTWESDDRKKIIYSYLPNTDRMTKKLITEKKKIVLRHFYEYDKHRFLVKEITDDGSGTEINDLTGVTQRKIKTIEPNLKTAVGLPEKITESYLDLQTGQEVQLGAIEYVYSIEGRVTEERRFDAHSNYQGSILRTYDVKGNVIEETNYKGEKTTRCFDANNNLIFEQGPNLSYHKEFTYDFSNRLIREDLVQADGERFITRHRYDFMNQKIATIDRYGNETRYVYNSLGKVAKVIYPAVVNADGTVVHPEESFTYDEMGNMTSKTDAIGSKTLIRYNIRGQPIETIFPDKTVERREYTIEGWLAKLVEPNGMTTCYIHDYQGRVIDTQIFSKEGASLLHTNAFYNAFHLLAESDGRGTTTSYTYDGAGRLIKEVKGNSITEYVYDSLGRISQTKRHTGNGMQVQIVQYDCLDRVIEERIEDEKGTLFHLKTFGYDEDGNRSSTTVYNDQGANTYQVIYNPFGQPIIEIDPLGNTTRTFYHTNLKNALDQNIPCTEVIDPLGNSTVTFYDALGRVVQTQNKDNLSQILHRQELFYNANGQRCRTIDYIHQGTKLTRKFVRTWSYNAMGQVLKEVVGVGSTEQRAVSYTYNTFSQKEKTCKSDGTRLFHIYDAFGRLQEFYSSDGTVHYKYFYDSNHNIISVYDEVQKSFTKRAYDVNDQIIVETQGQGLTFDYRLDKLGRLVRHTLCDGSAMLYTYNAARLLQVERKGKYTYKHRYQSYDLSGNLTEAENPVSKTHLTYRYDSLNRLTELAGPYLKEQVSYDAVHNVQRKWGTDAKGDFSSHFTYDALYQLASEEGTFNHSYTCDSLHNRLTKDASKYSVNAINQLLSDGTNSYTYDFNGNVTSKTTPNGTEKYFYDALDRLTKVQSASSTVEYTYDYLNRRLSKTVDGKKTLFFYQGQTEIGSCGEDGKILELQVLGKDPNAGVGSAIAFELQGEVFFPVYDYAGSLSHIVNKSNQVVESYRYTAFGEETSTTFKNPWRFAAKRFDSETGFIYFGQRYYMPSIGRWLTADPLGDTDGANLYAYLHHNPLSYRDRYGLTTEELAPNQKSDPEPSWLESVWNWTCETANSVWDSVTSGCSAAADYVSDKYDQLTSPDTFSGGLAHGTLNPCSTAYDLLYREEEASWGRVSGEIVGLAIGPALLALKTLQGTAAVGRGVNLLTNSVRGATITQRVVRSTEVAQPKISNTPTPASISPSPISQTSNAVKNAGIARTGRSKNHFDPDFTAIGAHTVFRRDPMTNKVRHYETFRPQTNPRNPNPWESVKRFDGDGRGHTNKVLNEKIETPHIHDPAYRGKLRYPENWEMPW